MCKTIFWIIKLNAKIVKKKRNKRICNFLVSAKNSWINKIIA